MAHRKVSSSTPKLNSPAFSAGWCNDVNDLVNRSKGHGEPGKGTDSSQRFSSAIVKVRNLTEADRRRGDVVQLGASLLTAVDPRHPWFEGNAVAEPIESKIAILRKPVKDAKLAEAQMLGVCIAWVNVTDADHTHAVAEVDSFVLKSATSGTIELLTPPDGTGEQELIVKIGGGGSTPVYEFVPCTGYVPGACGTSGLTKRLYITNPECATHVEGRADEDELVAAINRDGEIECWILLGKADGMKSGESVEILKWYEDCEQCSPPCYTLYECDNPSNNFQVRGYDWIELAGRIVSIDDVCYTVSSESIPCGSPTSITTADIQRCYRSCADCGGCYELTPCGTGSAIYVGDDLAGMLGEEDGAATIGTVIRLEGVCYEITDFESTCSTPPTMLGITSVETVPACNQCCYLFTRCSDGETTIGPYRPNPGDLDVSEYVNEDGTSNGKVIRFGDTFCYTASVPEDCSSATDGLPTVEETYDSCDDCREWCLEKCDSDPAEYLRTYADLAEYEPGTVLKRAEDGECWELLDSLGACSALEFSEFTVEQSFTATGGLTACEQCTDPKYVLTPSCDDGCDGCEDSVGDTSPTVIVTREDLADAVGRYVKVGGVCYLVSLPDSPGEVVTHETLTYQGPFDSCEACLAAATCLIIPVLEGGVIVGKKIVFTGIRVCGNAEATEPCPAE